MRRDKIFHQPVAHFVDATSRNVIKYGKIEVRMPQNFKEFIKFIKEKFK